MNIAKIYKLIEKFNENISFRKKRKILTKILKKGVVISFDYEKMNGEVKQVHSKYNPDYTYDVPPKESNFIYLFDINADFFKHYKLERISNITFE